VGPLASVSLEKQVPGIKWREDPTGQGISDEASGTDVVGVGRGEQ